MCLAMALFIANDALVKYVSASLPAAQLIFIRGLFATSLLLVAAWSMGALRPGRLAPDRCLAPVDAAPGAGARGAGRAGHDGLPDLAVSPADRQCLGHQHGLADVHRAVRGHRLARAGQLQPLAGHGRRLRRRAADRATCGRRLQCLEPAVPVCHLAAHRARPDHAHDRTDRAVHPDHADHLDRRAAADRPLEPAAGLGTGRRHGNWACWPVPACS